MRHIKRDRVVLPDGWLAGAEQAYTFVKNLPSEQRAKAINSRSRVWKKLKEVLQGCSYGKCWYCESLETATAPGDVDHFRPKNEVEECPDHSGYWWLAFDWKNYRYSCEHCNRPNTDTETGTVGGKASHFPLWDEVRRVFDESTFGGVLCEEPMLLDPVVASDVLLLTFDVEGTAVPTRDQKRYPKECKRAERSIELYHLNRSKLKNRRQFFVCNKIAQLVQDGDEYLLLGSIENSVAARQGYSKVVETISAMIDGRSEYSATARAMLKLYRDRDWVDELLLMAG